MTHHFHLCRITVATSFLLTGIHAACYAQSPIQPDQAIAIIKTLESQQESQIRNAQWKMQGFSGYVDDKKNPDRIRPDKVDPKVYFKRTVWYEPPTGRYRMEEENVMEWVDSFDQYEASVQVNTFDGKTERWYKRGQGGVKVPGLDIPGLGRIRLEKGNEFLERYGLWSGIGYFPPNHFDKRFSEFLNERLMKKNPVQVEADKDGTWTITTTTPEAVLSSSTVYRIGYDSRRGLVLWAEWAGNENAKPEWVGKVWQRQTMKWKEFEKGIWTPDQIKQVNLISGRASRWTYLDTRINQETNDSLYTFTFPVSTRLTDEIEKKIYVVSNGVIDEQKAIQEFMRAESLRDGDQPSIWRSWWMYSMILVGILGLGAVGAFVWHRKRVRNTSMILLVCFWSAQAASAAELDRKGNWRVSHAEGESYAISQCGLNVTVFALEYFGVDYQVRHVSVGLPPTEDGIRFLDIKTMLEAHGLEVIARDQVSLSDFKRVLRSGVLAIFPIKLNEVKNHYLVAMEHANRGRIVIDVPSKITALDKGLTAAQFSSLGGLVLFVRKPRSPLKPQASHVKLSPDQLDLGEFKEGSPDYGKILHASFKVTNKSERPLIVTSVYSSCSCGKANWEGGLLAARESREIPLLITPVGWGWGRVERYVTLVFADGSKAELRMLANKPKPEEIQQLKVVPDVLRIDLGKLRSDARAPEERVSLILGQASSEHLQVSSDAHWLRAELVKVEDRRGEVNVIVDPKQLAGCIFPANGTLSLSTRPTEPPVQLRVIVSAPSPYTLEPALLTLDKGKSGTVAIKPAKALNGSLDLTDSDAVLVAGPEGLSITKTKHTENTVIIEFRSSNATPTGYHLVTCRIGPERSGLEVHLAIRVD
jgi:hypothetical protein